ncbi:MAG: hypothetical protein PVH57_14445 [Syntrophobacterales bacterium]
MAVVQKDCSIFNAFNFKKELQDRVGHITQLKIGGTKLKADFTKGVKEPEDEKEVSVVGVLSDYYWEGGFVEPMQFNFVVSVANKSAVAELLHTKMKSIAAEIAFNIYEYDPEKKQFYKCVHTSDKAVKANIKVEGGERMLFLDDEANPEVQQPLNYQVQLTLVPEDEQQDIQVAFSVSKKITLPWGVTQKG